jgi:hypothetical protein
MTTVRARGSHGEVDRPQFSGPVGYLYGAIARSSRGALVNTPIRASGHRRHNLPKGGCPVSLDPRCWPTSTRHSGPAPGSLTRS